MAHEDAVASMRKECWAQAIHTFGTSWLFEQRAKKLRRRLQILTFLGIAVPVIVGASVLSFGTGNTFILQILVPLASVLGVIQVIVSVWALSAKWDHGHAYATESASENNRLYSRYRDLANTPLPTSQTLRGASSYSRGTTRTGRLSTSNRLSPKARREPVTGLA